MHCSQCQHENREGARFCEACGSQLEVRCPACRNLTRSGAAFCDSCGTPLTQESKVPSLKSKVENRSDSRLQTLGSSGLRTSASGLRTFRFSCIICHWRVPQTVCSGRRVVAQVSTREPRWRG